MKRIELRGAMGDGYLGKSSSIKAGDSRKGRSGRKRGTDRVGATLPLERRVFDSYSQGGNVGFSFPLSRIVFGDWSRKADKSGDVSSVSYSALPSASGWKATSDGASVLVNPYGEYSGDSSSAELGVVHSRKSSRNSKVFVDKAVSCTLLVPDSSDSLKVVDKEQEAGVYRTRVWVGATVPAAENANLITETCSSNAKVQPQQQTYTSTLKLSCSGGKFYKLGNSNGLMIRCPRGSDSESVKSGRNLRNPGGENHISTLKIRCKKSGSGRICFSPVTGSSSAKLSAHNENVSGLFVGPLPIIGPICKRSVRKTLKDVGSQGRKSLSLSVNPERTRCTVKGDSDFKKVWASRICVR